MAWSGSAPLSWPLPRTQCSSISSSYFKNESFPAFSSAQFPISRINASCSRSLIAEKNKTSRRACVGQLKMEDVVEDDDACDLVNRVELLIGAGDDEISAHLFKAVKNNNGTGILLLSDVYGFQDTANRDFAYRVACNGYNVLVPDLFRGDPWTKDRPEALFKEWHAGQSVKRVATRDIFASADWMVNEFIAAGISKKLGIIGFC